MRARDGNGDLNASRQRPEQWRSAAGISVLARNWPGRRAGNRIDILSSERTSTMANWLKPYSNVPATKTTAAPAKQEFEAKLAAFKKAHGFRERYTMLCHCSRHGRPFAVVFERASETERFTVSAVNKLAEHAGSDGGSAAPQEKSFDARQFNTSGWHCPWCLVRSWVHCHCGRNNCEYRFKQAGGTRYKCEPGCGSTGDIVTMTEITTTAASGAPAAKGPRAPALSSTNRTSLPKPNLPRLTGK
jgi:hypothetical protein